MGLITLRKIQSEKKLKIEKKNRINENNIESYLKIKISLTIIFIISTIIPFVVGGMIPFLAPIAPQSTGLWIIGLILTIFLFVICLSFAMVAGSIRHYFKELNESKNHEKHDSRNLQTKNERYDIFRWVTLSIYVLYFIYLLLDIEFHVGSRIIFYLTCGPAQFGMLLLFNMIFFLLPLKKGRNNKIEIVVIALTFILLYGLGLLYYL